VIQWRLSRLGDGLLCSGLDVTEERTLQAQLAHADRLTSLGSIAAGVAHELNNPLTAILGHLEMAVKEAERLGVEELVDMLSDCLEPARRMQATAGRLSSLAGTGDHALRPVDPAEVVRAAARLAANELSPRARVSLQLGATRLVRGHAARLTQVLLNLLTNAAHAVDRAPSGSHEILIGLTEDGDDVEIRVVDSGAGVAPPDRDRIFEPFVTTKNPTHSSGLGLSLARTIVREHGGTLELAPPRADRGACFVVRLPALPPAEPATTRQPPTASRRILVVDDEPVLRKLLRRMLRPHEVVEARDGLGARRLLEHDTFDLVICDVMMPGMSGPELHVWCAEHDPDQALRWLFLTGGAFTPSTRSYLHGCEVPCIDKPFSAAELVAAVQARMVESRTTP
jgi:nitrogen-specific signal transduction histidine kinase/CheY-like chemotaxis protein